MNDISETKLFTKKTLLFGVLICVLAFFTYFWGYWEPQLGFWDEGYHIASAQKYLNGVYFMEQHPPLGKLLIALGEKIFYPDGQRGVGGFYEDKFIGTDQASAYPEGFSFAGYRFFSAFLGWLTAPLFFLLFLYITRNYFYSTVFSFLYVFDNALIVHLRGAMLEGPLVFFTVLMILIYLLLLEYGNNKRSFVFLSFAFGISFALIATTKILGLGLIILLPAYLYKLLPNWKKIALSAGVFFIGFLVVYVLVWQIHFSLGKRAVSSLSDNGYYQASAEYRKILSDGSSGNVLNFPVMLRDSLAFIPHYNKGVPKLNLTEPAKEGGSPFFLWPLGARSINYRWDQVSEGVYKYVQLQSNPVVWLGSLFMLIIGISLLAASWFLKFSLKNKYLLAVFAGVYLSYMLAISQITRVLYLYSYFIPLVLSFVIFSIVFLELNNFGPWEIDKNRKKTILSIFAILVVASFMFYSPLTYHKPLSDFQVKERAVLPVWGLRCVNCPVTNILGVPMQ